MNNILKENKNLGWARLRVKSVLFVPVQKNPFQTYFSRIVLNKKFV